MYALIIAFNRECVDLHRHVSVNGGFDPLADLRCCMFSFARENTFLDSPLNKTGFDDLG